MRSLLFLLPCLAVIAAAPLRARGQSQPPSSAPAVQQPPLRDGRPFQSGVDITSITATVTDKEGHPLVTDLTRDQFEVYEDGVKQPVTQFTHERVPIGLGVLIDISDSMFGKRI